MWGGGGGVDIYIDIYRERERGRGGERDCAKGCVSRTAGDDL
eukprot:COSAG06_NODE_60760_length_270_cov_0.432749_1_plen_41_part_01